MPDFGTQVYWHDIPDCSPPWKGKEEHTKMWCISRSVAGNISDKRHMLNLSHADILSKRRQDRRVTGPQNHHWGIVLEPYLSPLQGVNMVMKELGVAPFTVEEAEKALGIVCEEYHAMTRSKPLRLQTSTTGKVKKEMMTEESNAVAMDLREAPLLEVVKLLCATRGLEVSTFGKKELHRKGRLSVADVLPRRRVIMAFDRAKPLFVFAIAVTLLTRSVKTPNAHYLQLVAPTSNPVPWRRLLRGGLPNLPSTECVVVAVQRHHNEGGVNDSQKYLGPEQVTPRRSKRLRETDGDSDDSGNATLSSNEDDILEKEINFGREPIFTAKDKLHDDPLLRTPVVSLRKMSQRARGVHDWIQRLVEQKARKKLYAIQY